MHVFPPYDERIVSVCDRVFVVVVVVVVVDDDDITPPHEQPHAIFGG